MSKFPPLTTEEELRNYVIAGWETWEWRYSISWVLENYVIREQDKLGNEALRENGMMLSDQGKLPRNNVVK